MAGRILLLRRSYHFQVRPHAFHAVTLLGQRNYLTARFQQSSGNEDWSSKSRLIALGILGTGCGAWLEDRQSAPVRCEMPFGQKAQGKAAEDAFKKLMGPGTHSQVRTLTRDGRLRIVDIVDEKNIFHEIKTGNVCYSQKIRTQIEKDIDILANNPSCKGSRWEVYPSKNGDATVTKNVKNALGRNGIELKIHDHSPESCHCFQNQVKDAVKEGRESVMKATPKEKMLMGVEQATILKAVGVANLAVALLALGSSIYIANEISKIRALLPELATDCEQLEKRLQGMSGMFELALSESKSALAGRESEFAHLMRGVQVEFNKIKAKCEHILRDAAQRKSQAEVNMAVGAVTAVLGLTVTTLSLGCDCGAGALMGLGGFCAGGAATAISLTNVDRCNSTMTKAGESLDSVMLAGATSDEKYRILMDLLGGVVKCHLVGNLWRVHNVNTDLGSHEIRNIRRPDSITMLKNVGGGRVLGAMGKDVVVVNYNGAEQGLLCSIENIWEDDGVFASKLQCRARMKV